MTHPHTEPRLQNSSDDEEPQESNEPVRTVSPNVTRITRKRSAQGRKQANTLMFQVWRGQRKLAKIQLRSRQLSAVLRARNISVAGARFHYLKSLPTGAHVASRFSLSLQSWTNPCRQPSVQVDVPNHSQWVERERASLSQTSSSCSYACVRQLQKQLTQELDSATVETDLEQPNGDYIYSDSSNDGKNEQGVTKTADEIDDIFGALDGLT